MSHVNSRRRTVLCKCSLGVFDDMNKQIKVLISVRWTVRSLYQAIFTIHSSLSKSFSRKIIVNTGWIVQQIVDLCCWFNGQRRMFISLQRRQRLKQLGKFCNLPTLCTISVSHTTNEDLPPSNGDGNCAFQLSSKRSCSHFREDLVSLKCEVDKMFLWSNVLLSSQLIIRQQTEDNSLSEHGQMARRTFFRKLVQRKWAARWYLERRATSFTISSQRTVRFPLENRLIDDIFVNVQLFHYWWTGIFLSVVDRVMICSLWANLSSAGDWTLVRGKVLRCTQPLFFTLFIERRSRVVRRIPLQIKDKCKFSMKHLIVAILSTMEKTQLLLGSVERRHKSLKISERSMARWRSSYYSSSIDREQIIEVTLTEDLTRSTSINDNSHQKRRREIQWKCLVGENEWCFLQIAAG